MIRGFKVVVCSIVASTLLVACQSQTMSPRQAEQAEQKVKANLQFKSDDKHAQLFVVREKAVMGFAVVPELSFGMQGVDKREKIGKVDNGAYYLFKLTPGNYDIGFGFRYTDELRASYKYAAKAGAVDIIMCDLDDLLDPEDCAIRKMKNSDWVELTSHKHEGTLTSSSLFKSEMLASASNDDYFSDFKKAEKANSLKAYQWFLNKHPKGMYTTTVQRRIKRLGG